MLRINADFPESYNSTRTNSSHAYSVALRFQTELVALYFGMASRMHMGIFFVNASQAEPGRNWRSRFSFFFYLDVLKPCMPVGDVLITGRNCGKFMACPFSGK